MPPEWVFGSPGPLADGAVVEFFDLATKISEQGDSWTILELFKTEFGSVHRSSSEGWAANDLRDAMNAAANNAPAFIGSFWRGMEKVHTRTPQHPLPDEHYLNAILRKNGVAYEVRQSVLIARGGPAAPAVAVPPSADEGARALIEASLAQADKFLWENKPRQAVQEILWLLETVSTAFAGQEYEGGTVEGKYFNEIVRDIRKHNRGSVLAQAGSWMTTLHGFLSSPTGGGVRHGTRLADKRDLKLHEATLYCNLTRSYIGYLLAELSGAE